MPRTDPFNIDAVAAAVLHASDAIIACDPDGIIRFWNGGAVRIFGFAASEAIGQSLDIIIPERLRARHWDGYRRTIRTGQSRYGDGALLSVPGQRKDGAPLSIEFTIVTMTDGQNSNCRYRRRDARRHRALCGNEGTAAAVAQYFGRLTRSAGAVVSDVSVWLSSVGFLDC